MALRRTRLVRIEPVQEGNIKYPFQVLWGEDGPEGRVVIMIDKKGMGIRQALADHPSKNLYERMKLDDDTFKLWDVETGKVQTTVKKKKDNYGVNAVVFSPDGKTLATGHFGVVTLWDVSAFTAKKK